MSQAYTGALCGLSDTGNGLECLPVENIELVPFANATIGPHVVPAVGGQGRTTFTVTYDNLSEPALSNARYLQLITIIDGYLSSIAPTLGPTRDQSLLSQAINVNLKINFAPLTQKYLITLDYGEIISFNSPGTLWWRYNITSVDSPGVLVKQVPTNNFSNPNIFPDSNFTFSVDSSTRELTFSNQFPDTSLNTPPGNFYCRLNACQFSWVYVPPSGNQTVPPIPIGSPGLYINASYSGQVMSQNSPYYVSATPTWVVGAAPSGDTNANTIARAGPNQFYIFPQNQNVQTNEPGLFNCTGVNLPAPTTPMPTISGANNGTSPAIMSSQYKVVRLETEWDPYRAGIDAQFGNNFDINMDISTDNNRLGASSTFFEYANTYTAVPSNKYCLKAILCHEIFHGLGFISGLVLSNGQIYAAGLFNHYLFVNQTPTPITFPTVQRMSPVAAGATILGNGVQSAPINPSSVSHLQSTGSMANGIMEAVIVQGPIVPTGTALNGGGPSQNDYFGLLCACVANSVAAPCVKYNTLVLTSEGEKSICDVRQGDLVLDLMGEWTPVIENISFTTSENFVVFPKHILSKEQCVPSNEIYICSGHPIVIDGREIVCEEFVGYGSGESYVKLISNSKSTVRVHTLVTERRNFVLMQGMLVGTWAKDAMDNFRENTEHPRIRILNE